MKRIVVSLPAIFLFVFVLHAQDKTVQELKKEGTQQVQKDPNDTIPKVWKKGGVFNLTFNQAALSNWAAGGDNSAISLNSFLHAFAFYKKNRNSWDNTLDLAYGFTATTSLGTRKTDDRIDVLSKYGYEIAKSWYLSLLLNARTQFAQGFNYPSNGSKILTSDFMAPAYVVLAPGVSYMPNDHFSILVSPVTVRWLFVENDSLSSIGAFGVDSGKHVQTQFGAYASISYTAKISENAAYTGRLDLFSNYLHNPQNIAINWTNLLAVKVTKLISMTLALNIIYDDNIKSVKSDGTAGGPMPQIQEILGIGLSCTF
jgi:Protein of unknown function (DUF3078)